MLALLPTIYSILVRKRAGTTFMVSTPTGKQEHFQRLMRYIQQGRITIPEEVLHGTVSPAELVDQIGGVATGEDVIVFSAAQEAIARMNDIAWLRPDEALVVDERATVTIGMDPAEDPPPPTIVGVALEDSDEGDIATVVTGVGRLAAFPVAFRHGVGSILMPGGYASMSASMAYWPRDVTGEFATPGRYQYTEKFTPEVRDKAWKLVEQHMTPDQYFAFMEGTDIELENVAGDFRLIISKSGKFTILEGARGAGIVAQAGRISSRTYPLGDEISAFIDWFNHRTKELIAQWGCGTYGIVKEDLRR